MRSALKAVNADIAWQYCIAVHCLRADELPEPSPIKPMDDEVHVRVLELCGGCTGDGLEPTESAVLAAQHLADAAETAAATCSRSCKWPHQPQSILAQAEAEGTDGKLLYRSWLADRLDDLAHRASRNGFQLIRPVSDGLFHRISYMNHCCAGMNNASWTWNSNKNVLTCCTTRDVEAAEELTISYIAKPWCDLAKRARRQYLKNNYNFVCLCKACCQPVTLRCEKAKSDTGSKLGGLLLRWLQDDGPSPEENSPAENASSATSSAAQQETGSAVVSSPAPSSGHQQGTPPLSAGSHAAPKKVPSQHGRRQPPRAGRLPGDLVPDDAVLAEATTATTLSVADNAEMPK